MQPVVFRFHVFLFERGVTRISCFFFGRKEGRSVYGIRSRGGTRFFFELKQRNGDVWDEESNEMKELKGRFPLNWFK